MNIESSALLTDLYQLTMLQGYFTAGMEQTAVFEFFVRTLPHRRNFLVAAGLEQVLGYLENFRFTAAELEWLAGRKEFRREFVEHLGRLRFAGDVDAMPEGTVFFPDEPILRVTAPLPVAQFVETRIINLLHYQTLVASKAARAVLAAPDKLLVDFGQRRAHGAEAALLAARASYLAGFSGTSNVLAGQLFDIPVYGTMAHSYVQAHEAEGAAFESFAHANPHGVVLLLDTYDTEAAAELVVRLAPKLTKAGIRIKAVRLDSGDLEEHARKVRRILDLGGLTDTRIFASGNLDEFELQRMTAAEAPIDGYGVGTRMDVSADAPYLDCAYKLQEYAGKPRRKRSEGKATWPGRKQVYRTFRRDGTMAGDVLTLEGDPQEGTALLVPCLRNGRRLAEPLPLPRLRQQAAAELARLPADLCSLETVTRYPVEVSAALRELAAAVDQRATGD